MKLCTRFVLIEALKSLLIGYLCVESKFKVKLGLVSVKLYVCVCLIWLCCLRGTDLGLEYVLGVSVIGEI